MRPAVSHAELDVLRFDRPVPYAEAYKRQLELRDALTRGEIAQSLMLLEHPPVLTLGRNAHEHHLLRSRDAYANMGIEILEVDRGGDVTYHGPGQLVAYPILDLRRHRQSVDWYMRALEAVIVECLEAFGIQGERLKGYTGVWVDGGKIAAEGVGIRDWITYHGIAINVAPNMDHFGLIVPCGIPDKPVTSMRSLLGEACPSIEEVGNRFEEAFRRTFGFDA